MKLLLSVLLSFSDCVNDTFLISVPKPSSVIVTSSPQEIFAGSNFTLHCAITLSVDVQDVSRSVSVTWIRPSNTQITASEVQQLSDLLMYSAEIQINSNDAGNYSCEAKVVTVNASYLIPSLTLANTTEIVISMCHYLIAMHV